MPASVLVLVLLTSLVIDAAAAFLAQRELADLCASAANDAAAIALSDKSVYRGATLEVDTSRARAVIADRVAALEVRWRTAVSIEVQAATSPATLDVALHSSAPAPIGVGVKHQRVSAECQVTLRRR